MKHKKKKSKQNEIDKKDVKFDKNTYILIFIIQYMR